MAVGQKPGLITVKAHGNTLFANMDRAFSTTSNCMRHFRLFSTLVGDLALEKGVLLLETTLDVYKRKLAYQVHREHRFINVSTDEVGQLFFIVFPALINIFFLSFFFCAFIDVNMLIYRMKNTYCKTCVKFSIYFAYNKFKFIQNYKYNFDFA